jgi:hypothetical protein
MLRLATALAANAFLSLGCLKAGAVAGGRFGGVAGAAANPLPQAGQLTRQAGELGAELLDLLLLGQNQLSGTGRPRQPVRALLLNPPGTWYRLQEATGGQLGICRSRFPPSGRGA